LLLAERNALQHNMQAMDVESPSPAELEQRVKELLKKASGTEKQINRKMQDEIEKELTAVARLYSNEGNAEKIKELLALAKPLFPQMSKAKTAKIVHKLVDFVGRIPGVVEQQIALCEECIEWAKETQRTFLRQKIESKLATCYLQIGSYDNALKLLERLLIEVKKFDDKLLLVEVELIESHTHFTLLNIPKAKAALTASRTAANAIYCPPKLQGKIDTMSALLHAEEKDFKTAFSYFYEAFESYNTMVNNLKITDRGLEEDALEALKYMLLCKIMLNSLTDVNHILANKASLRYEGRVLDSMRALANAHDKRSLDAFRSAKEEYKDVLTENDPVMARHLLGLEDTMFEQNLKKIIEPFSCVEIQHVASLMEMDIMVVEKKLSQMILDKKIHGILDQGADTLIMHDELPVDDTYVHALGVIANMGKVVDSLFEKAVAIH